MPDKVDTPGDLADLINDLIEASKDGEYGYKTAAEHVKNPELAQLFTQYSQQRAQFASELQALVPAVAGEAPKTEGSTMGALHRGWIAFREAINWENEVVVLAEVAKGEKEAIDEYEDALEPDKALPPNVRAVAERHLAAIREALARVEAIYDDPNKSDRSPIPGVHKDAAGTTAAGRAAVPDTPSTSPAVDPVTGRPYGNA
ncbi:MAG TPA: PA2169 family four-helix-bundle protein [bacterium]|nr:PA2169 family four-helix-bundle protein [bacterium]